MNETGTVTTVGTDGTQMTAQVQNTATTNGPELLITRTRRLTNVQVCILADGRGAIMEGVIPALNT